MPSCLSLSRRLALLGTVALVAAPLVQADDADAFAITLKDHRFTPQHLTVPAGKKLKLVITNVDKTPDEFDSDDLRREKDIAPGETVTVFIGPLKAGVYKFRGEMNPTTANGTITAK